MTRTTAAFRPADSLAGGIAAGIAGEDDVGPRPTTHIRSIGVMAVSYVVAVYVVPIAWPF